MTDRVLSDAEIEKMQTPVWDQAKAAIDAGDPDGAKALIDRAVDAVGGAEGLLDQLDHQPAHVRRRRARGGGGRAGAAQDGRRVRATAAQHRDRLG